MDSPYENLNLNSVTVKIFNTLTVKMPIFTSSLAIMSGPFKLAPLKFSAVTRRQVLLKLNSLLHTYYEAPSNPFLGQSKPTLEADFDFCALFNF